MIGGGRRGSWMRRVEVEEEEEEEEEGVVVCILSKAFFTYLEGAACCH